MLRDIDEDVLQSWVDAMSEGAAQALLLCIEGHKPIGWAGLSTDDGQRCGLVLVVLGGELADETIKALESVHGPAEAFVVRDS
jgi:hypothetical protein